MTAMTTSRAERFAAIWEELFRARTDAHRSGARPLEIDEIAVASRVYRSEVFAEFARRYPDETPLHVTELEDMRSAHEAARRRLRRAGYWTQG